MAIALFLISLGSLAAIWLGYPLLIVAAGSLRRARGPLPPLPVSQTVSLIIASREPWEEIEKRLEDCRVHCDRARVREVIVGSDHADGIVYAGPAARDPWIRVVRSDSPGGKAAALNASARAAAGELLVFTDTHQRFAPGAIERLIAPMADERLGAASGALDLSTEGEAGPVMRAYWGFEKWLRRAESRVHSVVGVTGALYVARRSAWQPIPPGVLLDDLWVPMRMVLDRRRIGFVPEAGIRDLRPVEPSCEYRRKVRTLTGVLQLCRWLPDILNPVRNPIWFEFVCHKLLRLLSPVLVLTAVLSGSVLAGRSLSGLPSSARLAAAIGAGLLLLGLLLPWRPGARARQALRVLLLMQLAPLHALGNGLRGRWHIWGR